MTGAQAGPYSDLVATAAHDVERGLVPACQLAVAREGRLLLFEALGEATTSTRFCAFSATKPIVAAAVWLLIGDGSLDVSKPVAHYAPEFGANGKEKVTVEQVLLHTAGFPNAPISPAEGADAARRRARFSAWHLEWDPGTRFQYHAASAHWVLADLLERLTGEDFRDVVETRVCRPLGLPRVLGIGPADQGDIAPLTPMADPADNGEWRELLMFNDPAVREAGVPAAGAIVTAADLALFYQGLLHNPGGIWRPDVLRDGTANIRCRLPDPLMDVPANRTIGLVVAGDDGQHILRYASFGQGCSPGAFGHAGAHGQIGWADPATGVSFAYLNNAVSPDPMVAGRRAYMLSTAAAALLA
ncbi:MAG TPA: serine hydrolase domain-containing protein [Acidimicrobiales bacterium]|nr:serine hydrolase domain-containing protein [Acidimicrobiales bacterium]